MIAVALVILLGGALASWFQWWTTDDAFISFRYAENLSEGKGLVFNEGERVEGYSNFLWTLWIAAGLSLGFEAGSWANIWGLVFREWKGSSKRTHQLIVLGILVLVASICVVGWGSYLKKGEKAAAEANAQSSVVITDANSR